MHPEMKPALVTDPAFSGILDELIRREPIFHRAEFGTIRIDFENMMHHDFWEVGASGRRYSREFVLAELEKRHQHPREAKEDIWQAKDFHCRQLAPNIYLFTYTLLQDNVRLTRRTTIWQQTEAGWKIMFHQGTVVQAM